MELLGKAHCCIQALALFGEHMKEHGAVGLLGEFEVLDQFSDVMPVDGPEVAQAEFLEETRLDEEILGLALPLRPKVMHFVPMGKSGEEFLQVVVDAVVGGAGGEFVEVARHRTDVASDRPFVVVEDDDETLGGAGHVVEPLQGDTAGEGSVPADGDDMLRASLEIACGGHAEGRAQGGARVTRTEGIVGAFGAHEEAAGPVCLTDLLKKLTLATGQQFVNVALMGDIEDEGILG